MSPQWYEAMGKRMKERDHALSMIERWQKKLSDAEEQIQALTAEQGDTPEPVSAPEE